MRPRPAIGQQQAAIAAHAGAGPTVAGLDGEVEGGPEGGGRMAGKGSLGGSLGGELELDREAKVGHGLQEEGNGGDRRGKVTAGIQARAYSY